MLTNEQKEVVIKKLQDRWDALRSTLAELSVGVAEVVKTEWFPKRDKVMKYKSGLISPSVANTLSGDIDGKYHYNCSFTSYGICYLHVYINRSDCYARGRPLSFGICDYIDAGRYSVCSVSNDYITRGVMDANYDTIAEFVHDYIDTDPNQIIKMSKWLDAEWLPSLRELIERYINCICVDFADMYNAATEKENTNDNIILQEFGMSNTATTVVAKKYKVTIKEVK